MEFPRMCPARWLADQNLGVFMPPHDFMYPFYDTQSNYYRPWKRSDLSISKEFSSTIENEKGNYKITLDVQHFRANEINVKVADGEIIVEGKHEERPDIHGFVTRQFKRRYPLPSHCPPENVTSTLSSDSILTIIAEKNSFTAMEKIVPIKMCGAYSRKTQADATVSSELLKETRKESLKSEDSSKNKYQTMLKEEHSRLLKPELLKDSISETNGTCSKMTSAKEATEIVEVSEKTDPLRTNIGSTSNKIEETIEKSILGLTALTEQLGQCTLASTSETCKKTTSEMAGAKKASAMSESEFKTSETSGKKSITEVTDKIASDMTSMKDRPAVTVVESTCDTLGTKSGVEMSGLKNALEMSSMKSASETSSTKGMTRTLIEESSSSYKSSSAMSSSLRVSGKSGDFATDISAELREAAENV